MANSVKFDKHVMNDEDVEAYLDLCEKDHMLRRELEWLIKNHVDTYGLDVISDIVVNLVYK